MSLNSNHHTFYLIIEPAWRVSGVLARIVESVFTCGSRSVVLDLLNLEVASSTPYTHVQTRQCASLLNQPQC